jgi:hypothetical protein
MPDSEKRANMGEEAVVVRYISATCVGYVCVSVDLFCSIFFLPMCLAERRKKVQIDTRRRP